MERHLNENRARQWNSHVREAVRNGERRRSLFALTAVIWVLLLAAVVILVWRMAEQNSQMERLEREEEQVLILAAQEEARRLALQDQLGQPEQNREKLREQQDAVRTQAREVRPTLAKALLLPPAPVAPHYTQLYPELYAAPADRETLAPGGIVYLTFDDGPSARTAEVLDILKANGIKATFFVTGQTGELAERMMRRIVEEGHTIAIHTYTHDYQEIYASVEAYLDDFARIYNWVYEVTGVCPQIFRFPGGTVNSFNQDLYQELVAEMDRRGFVHYDWNAMCGDADGKPHTPEELAYNSLAKLGADRAIILMHDSAAHTATVACLPMVIAGYRNAGYTFAPLTPEVKAITFD